MHHISLVTALVLLALLSPALFSFILFLFSLLFLLFFPVALNRIVSLALGSPAQYAMFMHTRIHIIWS